MSTASDLIREAGRQLTICNACRYCEGYCPVFPAIEIRRDFPQADVFFLANLCHDCRACYYACMYAPPHEFAINIPFVLSQSRRESYYTWSWPSVIGESFRNRRSGVLLALGTAAAVLVAGVAAAGRELLAVHRGPGAFYKPISFSAILVPSACLFFFALVACAVGGARFWHETAGKHHAGGLRALFQTIANGFTLTWLRGGGPGCYYPQTEPSSTRRVYHSLVYFGMLFAVISTTLAAYYQHFLNRLPPYALTSAPVLFGTAGGVSLLVGVSGLIVLKRKSDREPADPGTLAMDYSFLILLGLNSLSGLLTLALRDTWMMGSLLIVHLALVAALFITLPYGKFVHSIYRSLAVLRYHLEQTSHRASSSGEERLS